MDRPGAPGARADLSRVHCTHAARCPGCPLIDRTYPEQLAFKRATLVRALGAYHELAGTEVLDTAGAEPVTDFRLRTKVVVEGRALGLFARGTHDVVDVPECRVLRPRLHAVAAALRAALPLRAPVSSFDLREADDGVLVTAAVAPAVTPDARRALAESIAELDRNVASVAVSLRDDDAPQVLGGALEVLVGPSELRHRPDPAAPWHYAAHGAFTQAHAGQIARLHAAIESELCRDGARRAANGAPAAERSLAGLAVLELYAGSGALALRLAARGARVTLVESFAPAVRLAERAASEQRLVLDAVAGDANVALAALAERRGRFDAVIVDPPRRGLAPDVRRRIAALAPKLVLYVSCAPETLARDAAHFAHLGLRLEQATPFDMIPQSDAVETLARFTPHPPPAPVVLASGASFLALALPAHADGTASGVAVVPRSRADTHAVERLLAESRAEYLLLARGILRASGTLPLGRGNARARYERLEVLGGHSLLRVTAKAGGVSALLRALAALRHPVVGDARHGDRRTNAHFLHRHELERAFLHRSAVTLALGGETHVVEAPLAPDLARVLESLRA
ncbi:MAG TPA: RsmD family RNA methyltransferase [Polyangiaceae bacterium]|nr:RsmD family RNA methyltransferase [Polyangiaceae bacterium]